MAEHAFFSSIKDALADLQMAYAEAEAELPEEIKREHYQLWISRTVIDCWSALSCKYPHNRALDALALIDEFRAKLKGLQIRAATDGTTPNLKLGKARK